MIAKKTTMAARNLIEIDANVMFLVHEVSNEFGVSSDESRELIAQALRARPVRQELLDEVRDNLKFSEHKKNIDAVLICIGEAAQLLGVSRRHVRRLCEGGEIGAKKIGGRWMIPKKGVKLLVGSVD